MGSNAGLVGQLVQILLGSSCSILFFLVSGALEAAEDRLLLVDIAVTGLADAQVQFIGL